MQRKTIAALDCGVEIKDFAEGILFTGYQPGHEFSFPVSKTEVGQLIEYLTAYRDMYVTGPEQGAKMRVGPVTEPVHHTTTVPVKENPEKYKDTPPADAFAGRSAQQTSEIKPAPNAGRAGAIVRASRDVTKTDLAKEVESAKLTVQ